MARRSLEMILIAAGLAMALHVHAKPPRENGPPSVLNVRAARDGQGSNSIGPDVIVGDLSKEGPEPYGMRRFGRVGDITAYSVGTVDCNAGSEPVRCIGNTSEHPVTGFNLYRLKDGRLEQIGMSWLRHEFFVLSQTVCFPDCQTTDGSSLGVHCSNPHSSSINGTQSNLSPRHLVHPAFGVFPYPWTAPAYPATIGRRLQVHDADLHPPSNAGALYFLEGHEVAPDDAQAGNGCNNASYRRVQVIWSGGASTTYNLDFVPGQGTHRESPAILAWHDSDPQVVIGHVDIAGDGRLILASKATDLGGGLWHYEYALYNMNSDRSVGAITIPVPAGTTISNAEFHDVDYHSFGANNESFYDGTDWSSSTSSGSIAWAATPFAENENANAVRWGTSYNFRFDADRPSGGMLAEVGLFKPGTPGSVHIEGTGPVVPVATMIRAVSRKTCDLDLLPALSSEPRLGGISQMCITFDVPPACSASNGVEICETTCANGSLPAPYSGDSVVSCSVSGSALILNFTPGLENGRTYRIFLGPDVTSTPGQFVDVRGLMGDVNSDGRVDATDRSVVVGIWTGPGFTCSTDIDMDGITNATDRSLVIGAWTGSADCAPDPALCTSF